MRFILSLLLIIVFSFLAGMILPWWSIALIAFVTGLFLQRHLGTSFLAGFLAIFLLWGGLAWWIDIKNESILSAKIAVLFPLGGSSAWLILVTAVTGGLVAGFAAMAGAAVRPRSGG